MGRSKRLATIISLSGMSQNVQRLLCFSGQTPPGKGLSATSPIRNGPLIFMLILGHYLAAPLHKHDGAVWDRVCLPVSCVGFLDHVTWLLFTEYCYGEQPRHFVNGYGSCSKSGVIPAIITCSCAMVVVWHDAYPFCTIQTDGFRHCGQYREPLHAGRVLPPSLQPDMEHA